MRLYYSFNFEIQYKHERICSNIRIQTFIFLFLCWLLTQEKIQTAKSPNVVTLLTLNK